MLVSPKSSLSPQVIDRFLVRSQVFLLNSIPLSLSHVILFPSSLSIFFNLQCSIFQSSIFPSYAFSLRSSVFQSSNLSIINLQSFSHSIFQSFNLQSSPIFSSTTLSLSRIIFSPPSSTIFFSTASIIPSTALESPVQSILPLMGK